MGGLSKKAFQYQTIRESKNLPALIVDAGNLLFKHSKIDPKQEEQEKATALGIVESYSKIGFDAVGIAREDLIAGLAFFRQIVTASSFPWLSANLVNQQTNAPLFKESVILSKGGIRVAVTGLTNNKLYYPFSKEKQVTILDWTSILPGVISRLKEQSDIIVLLSNLPQKENERITEKFPDIHIIIQAGVSSTNKTPELMNKTLVCQAGKQGKQIGIMEISWHNAPWGYNLESQLTQNKKSLDRLQWQLSKFDRYKNPEQDLKDNPSALQRYANILKEQERYLANISRLEQEIGQQKDHQKPSTFTNRFMAMQTSLPDHQEVLKIVDKTTELVNTIGRKQKNKTKRGSTNYVGSSTCGTCHESQFSSWKESRHAKAYTTLLQRKQQFNLNCLPCHITGDGSLDNSDIVHVTQTLQGVGCENCHGPGKQHQSQPKKFHLTSNPTADKCLQCHTEEHDDNFDYSTDVKKLHCQGLDE